METLPENPILKFNPNVIQDIRKEYNLHHPGAMKEVIDNFEDWIKKQTHFTKKEFPRHYLESTLIQSKGSLERAKNSFDKICTLKTLMAEFFEEHDVKNLPDFTYFTISAILPRPLKNNYRTVEYLKLHDYSMGLYSVVDCRDVNIINYAMKINLIQLKQLMSILIEGYGMRIKGIHILSPSKAVDVLITIIKQVVSSKISGRIQVHKTLEDLHKHVSKEVLPKEYGGEEKPLLDIYDDWLKVLGADKSVEAFKEMCHPGTNEAYRQIDKYNDKVLGMPGSFRTLTLD